MLALIAISLHAEHYHWRRKCFPNMIVSILPLLSRMLSSTRSSHSSSSDPRRGITATVEVCQLHCLHHNKGLPTCLVFFRPVSIIDTAIWWIRWTGVYLLLKPKWVALLSRRTTLVERHNNLIVWPQHGPLTPLAVDDAGEVESWVTRLKLGSVIPTTKSKPPS